jgi:hypothetical protein
MASAIKDVEKGFIELLVIVALVVFIWLLLRRRAAGSGDFNLGLLVDDISSWWNSLWHEEDQSFVSKEQMDAAAAQLINDDPDLYGNLTSAQLEDQVKDAVENFQNAASNPENAVAKWIMNNRVF